MSTEAVGLGREASFMLGGVSVEPALLQVRSADGTEYKLEPRVMQVLVALAGAKGALLSRTDLRDACWGGRLTSDDAIERVIAQLRRLAVSLGGTSFTIQTVPKLGYRLIENPPPQAASRQWRYGRREVLVGIAGATIAAGAASLIFLGNRTSGTARKKSGPLTIAVLPFTAQTPSPQLSSFAAGLSDEVRSDLSRIVDIRVIAQTSSQKAAKESGTAQQVGKSLGADYLVEADVGSGNGQLVTNLALVDATTGAEVWTTQEYAPLANPTGLRPALAGDVIEHLAGIIPISSQYAPPVRRPDPEAYALVQQANRLLEDVRTNQMRGRQEDALNLGEQAERLTKRALTTDPNYSAALALLASITRNGWTPELARQNLTTKQRVEASIAILRRALLADPRDPAALTALGDYYRRYEFRWDEAENLFRRALSIDPSFVDAHWSFGYELGTLGRGLEGLDHALSVFELDPRNPFRRVALPRLLYLVGDRPEAMRRYDAELREQPDNLFLLQELYFVFLSEGNATDLQKLGQRVARQARTPQLSALASRIDAGAVALRGNPQPLRTLIDGEVAAFDRKDAISNATPQGRARDDLPFIFAIEYAWAGRPEQAIDMLERAISAKSLYWPCCLPYGNAPFSLNMRTNPRFQALWERDPGVVQLIERRRRALLTGQMAGFTPDGRKLVPRIGPALSQRIAAALAVQE